MRRAVRTVASGVAKRSDMDEGVENDFSVPPGQLDGTLDEFTLQFGCLGACMQGPFLVCGRMQFWGPLSN